MRQDVCLHNIHRCYFSAMSPRFLFFLFFFLRAKLCMLCPFVCLFRMFELLCINIFELQPYIKSNEKYDVHRKMSSSLIQLFSLSQKGYYIIILNNEKKTRFTLKKGGGGGGLNLKISDFGWKGAFFRQKFAKGGSNLGTSVVCALVGSMEPGFGGIWKKNR